MHTEYCFRLKWELMRTMKQWGGALDAAAIGIPYPRMSIHDIYMDKLNSKAA